MNVVFPRAAWIAAIALGAIGLAGAIVAAILDTPGFLASWLFAFRFWLGLPLGALGLLMVQHLAGGLWGYLLRRTLEAMALTVVLFAAAFVPLLLGVRTVWPWARAGAADHDAVFAKLQPYLNVPFFTARTVLWFALWIGMAWLLSAWSRDLDTSTSDAPAHRLRALSAPGLILLILTETFSAVDWTMSLERHWSSTVYGFIWAVGDALVAMSVAALVLTWRTRAAAARTSREAAAAAELADAGQYRRIGNLLLAMVVLWAYMQFAQFLVIWSGNLPREISFYVHRSRGGWEYVAQFLMLFQFGVPFALLLFRRNKRRAAPLCAIAAGLVVVRAVTVFWMILPAFRPGRLAVTWIDLACFVGVGGAWACAFGWALARRSLLPVRDVRFAPLSAASIAPQGGEAS